MDNIGEYRYDHGFDEEFLDTNPEVSSLEEKN